MGRKQEIQNEAQERYLFSSLFAPFIKGAEWADSTLIEKVCDFITSNGKNYFVYDNIEDECYLDVESMTNDIKALIK